MEQNHSDEGPLWSFVADVCVGEPVGKTNKANQTFNHTFLKKQRQSIVHVTDNRVCEGVNNQLLWYISRKIKHTQQHSDFHKHL